MKYPLVAPCICFCLGIIVGVNLKISFLAFFLLAILFLILGFLFIKARLKSDIFILCLFLFMGSALIENSQRLNDSHISHITPHKSTRAHLVGVVDTIPIEKTKSISFILRSEKIKSLEGKWSHINGRVLVKLFKDYELSYGDRLQVEGKLYKPFSFSDEFNYKDYLKHKNIYSIFSIKKDSMVQKIDENNGNPIKSLAFKVRGYIKGIITDSLPPFSSSMLNAIILGYRQDLSGNVRDILVKTGSVHIIAISGLHLAIACFINLLILKILRVPRRSRYIITILLLAFYCMLTGARIPVMRATIMAVVLLFGYIINRRVSVYNSLAIGGFLILLINPWQLFEVSFQLSFISVISIVWLSPKIKALFPLKLSEIKWMRFLILSFSVSSAAWLGLLPLVAHNFGIVTPIAIFSNMIIVPYMGVIIASGFTLVAVSILAPALSPIFSASCNLFVLILFKISAVLVSVPGAYFKLSIIPVGYVIGYYVLVLFIFNFKRLYFIVSRKEAL